MALTEQRARLGSRLGFLMLAAGCAVGLGNVWRFPFVTGQNGGAAFVCVYLVFLALLGFPLLTAELALGRAARLGISGALRTLAPEGRKSFWGRLGCLIFGGNLLLMVYYTDVAGWLLRYACGYVIGSGKGILSAPGAEANAAEAAFEQTVGSFSVSFGFMLVVVALATIVCLAGVVKGVERVTKWMMLSLLALLVVLAGMSLTLPGAAEGLRFYLRPDWGPLLAHPFKVCFDAMGQAFFTLSVGVGAMTIFGSYVSRERTLVTEALWIILIDTAVALLAGFVIFPACATYHVDVSAGPGLIFVALPKVFANLAAGRVWGGLFFLFLSLAALTTIIAVFECLIGGLVDETRWSRRTATLLVGIVVAVLSLPAVCGSNVWKNALVLGKDLLSFEDFIFSQFWLPLGALAICVFCTWPIGCGWQTFRDEASLGSGQRLPQAFRPYLRYGLPLILLTVLVGGLDKSFFATSFVQMLRELGAGFAVTVEIFLLTVLFSLPLGLAVAFGRMARNPLISSVFRLYISIVRGTPLMLQIIFVYYGPYYLFGMSLSGYPLIVATVIAFSLNYAAYFAEIYRGGIESIEVGQWEAAKSLGMGSAVTFVRIILPQVVKRVLPAVTNEVITLVKDTSLAFTIALIEMFTVAKQLSAANTTIVPLVTAGVFYYVFNFVVAWTMERIEKSMSYYR